MLINELIRDGNKGGRLGKIRKSGLRSNRSYITEFHDDFPNVF